MRSLILGMVVLALSTAANADTWLTASLASYHFKRADYCEINPGIGFEYGDKFRVVAGTYKNSLCNPSNYVGVSWAPIQYGTWRAGVALLAITGYESEKKKKERNENVIFAPLPVVSWEGRKFGLNFVVIPPYDDFRGAVGFQAKVRF